MTSILLGIVRICCWLFKRNYLKNEKLFLSFLFHLSNFQEILNISQKRKFVIANVFPKLQNVKDLLRALSKKRRFRTSFDSQDVKGSLTLRTSAWQHLYHIFSSLWEQMIWKMSPLMKFEGLGALVNTLTADEKYTVMDCQNLQFPIQIRLC